MSICVYPGSFDPVTLGHKDIIERATVLFDKVYVALLHNSEKEYMFTISERKAMLEAVCYPFRNTEVVASDGMLADVMVDVGAHTIIRGLRSNADLHYEQQLAVVNNKLVDAETVVLLSKPEMQFLSSSIVRELISYQADVSEYVPMEIVDIVYGGSNL